MKYSINNQNNSKNNIKSLSSKISNNKVLQKLELSYLDSIIGGFVGIFDLNVGTSGSTSMRH